MRNLLRYNDGQLRKSHILLWSSLFALAIAAALTVLFLPTSPSQQTINLPTAAAPDTAMVYKTSHVDGEYQTARIGTYVWEADGNLSLASQLFNDTATRVDDMQHITVTLRPGQTVTGAYTCQITSCIQPTPFTTTSDGATIVAPTDTLVVILVQGGWSQRPGNAQLIANSGLNRVLREALSRDAARLGEIVKTA